MTDEEVEEFFKQKPIDWERMFTEIWDLLMEQLVPTPLLSEEEALANYEFPDEPDWLKDDTETGLQHCPENA